MTKLSKAMLIATARAPLPGFRLLGFAQGELTTPVVDHERPQHETEGRRDDRREGQLEEASRLAIVRRQIGLTHPVPSAPLDVYTARRILRFAQRNPPPLKSLPSAVGRSRNRLQPGRRKSRQRLVALAAIPLLAPLHLVVTTGCNRYHPSPLLRPFCHSALRSTALDGAGIRGPSNSHR
jgi:hypothetical protein